jgi:hypothetical protein
MTMNDASTMMSESLIDRIDMDQFYGAMTGALDFSCLVSIDDYEIFAKLNGFSRSPEKTVLTLACPQDEVQIFITSKKIKKITIMVDNENIMSLSDHRLDALEVDINHLHDLNCHVKLTI